MGWNVVKELYSFVYQKSGYGYVIQIGYWEIEGAKHPVTLVKRRFRKGDSGYINWEKGAVGFDNADVYRIFDNARLIADLMDVPIPEDMMKLKDDAESNVEKQLEFTPSQ